MEIIVGLEESKRWKNTNGGLYEIKLSNFNLLNFKYTDFVGQEPDKEFPFDTADALHMGGYNIFLGG